MTFDPASATIIFMRRGRHEGSVYWSPVEQRWIGSVSLGVGANGKRVRKLVRDADRTECLKKLRELQSRADVGGLEPSKEHLGGYLGRWLEDVVRLKCRRGTYRTYETALRMHIIPRIGGIPLGKVTAVHVHGLLAKMERDGSSPAARRLVRAIFRSSMMHALRLGLIERNPVELTSAPTVPQVEFTTWSPEQASVVLAWLKAERPIDYALVYVALSTGMRISEICGLRWSDVDLPGGKVTVHRKMLELAKKDGGAVLEEPKTKAARRTIALAPDVISALTFHKAELLKRGLTAGPNVFVRPGGEHYTRSRAKRLMESIVQATGVPKIRIHDLRHTSATWLMAQGVSPKVVQQRLGHSNVAITLDVYSHVSPGMDQDAASLIGGLLTKGSEQ